MVLGICYKSFISQTLHVSNAILIVQMSVSLSMLTGLKQSPYHSNILYVPVPNQSIPNYHQTHSPLFPSSTTHESTTST